MGKWNLTYISQTEWMDGRMDEWTDTLAEGSSDGIHEISGVYASRLSPHVKLSDIHMCSVSQNGRCVVSLLWLSHTH